MRIEPEFLDSIAHKVLEEFGAPGLSVALVMDGSLVSRAYGLADASTGEALTPDAAFAVGSSTKGFTALAMAILREQGALDWDDPVARFAGDLCADGGEQRQSITIRDILSHQSGFGWHDPLWYNSPWDRAAVIRKAWQAGPARPPRSRFQYCNVMYMLAGEIVARVSGLSYESFVRTRILQPLGLDSAHFSNEQRPGGLAQPHEVKDGSPRRIELPDVAKANAACGLRISAPDLAVWGSQFCRSSQQKGIPLRAFESVVAPQVAIGPLEGSRFYALFGQPDWVEYGFGWFLRRYRGHRVVFHTGRLPGAGSHIAVLPDLGFGVAALANVTFACLAEAVSLALLERFVGGPQTDWISYYREISKELASAAGTPSGAAPQSDLATGSDQDSVWAGDYVDPAYGRIQVRKQRGLEFRWANYRGDLLPASGTAFRLVNLDCPLLGDGELVEFLDEGGRRLLFLGRSFESTGAVSRCCGSAVESDFTHVWSNPNPVLTQAAQLSDGCQHVTSG